jgi:hypothetical protein
MVVRWLEILGTFDAVPHYCVGFDPAYFGFRGVLLEETLIQFG